MNGASVDAVIVDELAETTAGDDGIDHVVCCEDENLAMCGKDVTGLEWGSDGTNQSCVVCALMDDVVYRRVCRGESCGTGCPKGMRRE